MKKFRLNRLRCAGETEGFDCLVASSPENISYMTGGYSSVGQSVSASTQIYTVFSFGSNEVSYVVSVADVANILEFAGLNTKIYCYGPFHFEFTDGENEFVRTMEKICSQRFDTAEKALCIAVNAAGKHPGFDETHINFSIAEKIKGMMKTEKLVCASAVFREARRMKHPEEIELLRQSARIAEESLMEALDGAKPGITEKELQEKYRKAVVKRGADPYFFVATASYRAAFVDAHNTDFQIQKGDMIRFDFGCIWKGMYSDLARTAVMGEGDAEIIHAYEAVKKGAESVLSKLRPGVTAGFLFDTAVESVRMTGLNEYKRSHCGHGIGLEGYDVPSVASGVEDIIQKDMVMCIETPYYKVGWGGVQIENTIAVTEDGYEFLDSGNMDLIVIPV